MRLIKNEIYWISQGPVTITTGWVDQWKLCYWWLKRTERTEVADMLRGLVRHERRMKS